MGFGLQPIYLQPKYLQAILLLLEYLGQLYLQLQGIKLYFFIPVEYLASIVIALVKMKPLNVFSLRINKDVFGYSKSFIEVFLLSFVF